MNIFDPAAVSNRRAPRRLMQRLPLRAATRPRCAALLLLGMAELAAGCDRRGSVKAEARALMTSLNAVSDQGSLTLRSAALDDLQRLELHEPTHVQTRNVCRAAHQGLLDAEVAQAEARRALAKVGTLEPSQAQVIAADIERSNKALSVAKQRFPECETAMRELIRVAH